jgi:hypothetical protein
VVVVVVDKTLPQPTNDYLPDQRAPIPQYQLKELTERVLNQLDCIPWWRQEWRLNFRKH